MINRRQFISSSIAAGATLMTNPLETIAKPFTTEKPLADYKLIVLATNWGFPGSWNDFCKKAKETGYDAAEIWWPSDEGQRNALFEALAKHGLKIAFLYGSGEKDFGKHETEFRQFVDAAVKTKPLYINCHSGKDYFTLDQKEKLISYSLSVSDSSGIPIYHETHRGRALYAAPITMELMKRIPRLRLTLDISHWCNVHESLLGDQDEVISMALDRTDHIHARIGHPEGPQVSDPRAPEWNDAVQAHFAWWDKVAEKKRKEGKTLTMLTEFGPADYMPTIPYTRQPVADQWGINAYMMEVLRKRYS